MKIKNTGKIVLSLFVLFSFGLMSRQASARSYSRWEEVLSSRSPVNIYVEKVNNVSEDEMLSEERSTEVVKGVFAGRNRPRFNLVGSKDEACIVFEGEVYEYVWSEEAPVTNIWSAGALAMDLATRSGKNYARKLMRYRIYDRESGRVLLDGTTQVTLKQSGMPEESSYEMIHERADRILAMDLFSRWERRLPRSRRRH